MFFCWTKEQAPRFKPYFCSRPSINFSMERKPQFDVVAFDWKGTLEAKLGGVSGEWNYHNVRKNYVMRKESFMLALHWTTLLWQRNLKITFVKKKGKYKVILYKMFLTSESKVATTKTKLLEISLDKVGITHPEKRNQVISAYFESKFVFLELSFIFKNTTTSKNKEFYLNTPTSCFLHFPLITFQ